MGLPEEFHAGLSRDDVKASQQWACLRTRPSRSSRSGTLLRLLLSRISMKPPFTQYTSFPSYISNNTTAYHAQSTRRWSVTGAGMPARSVPLLLVSPGLLRGDHALRSK